MSSLKRQRVEENGEVVKDEIPTDVHIIRTQMEILNILFNHTKARMESDKLLIDRATQLFSHMKRVQAYLIEEHKTDDRFRKINDGKKGGNGKKKVRFTDTSEVILHFHGTPGQTAGMRGSGWCLTHASGTPIAFGHKFIGTLNTTMEADFEGLLEGLRYIREKKLKLSSIVIQSDSALVSDSNTSLQGSRAPNLVRKTTEVSGILHELANQGCTVAFSRISPEENTIAAFLSAASLQQTETDRPVLVHDTFEDANMVLDLSYLKKTIEVA